MNLIELMTQLQKFYDRKGGEIQVRIGKDGDRSNEIRGIQIDNDNNIVIY